MFAHRAIRPIHGRRLEIELPEEFAECSQAEVIVLPMAQEPRPSQSWEQCVAALAGTLGDDFPDDVDADDLPRDTPREPLE